MKAEYLNKRVNNETLRKLSAGEVTLAEVADKLEFDPANPHADIGEWKYGSSSARFRQWHKGNRTITRTPEANYVISQHQVSIPVACDTFAEAVAAHERDEREGPL